MTTRQFDQIYKTDGNTLEFNREMSPVQLSSNFC